MPSELKKIFNNGEKNNLSKVKTIVGEKIGLYHETGIKDGTTAAMITAAILTVDNVSLYINGEISAEEMAADIAKGTAKSGVMGYSEGFIRTAVAKTMQKSSHQLIKSLGKSNVPAAVISFGVTSFDTVVDYAQGEIDSQELVYDLGENAVGVAGGTVGFAVVSTAGAKIGASAGAAVGTVIPGAGNAVGAIVGGGVGLVGGMVGYAITTEAYVSVVDACVKYGEDVVDTIEEIAKDVGTVVIETGEKVITEVKELGDKTQKIAKDTIKLAEEFGEDVANNVKDAIANFNIENALPW